jgi:predicted nucleotidyltransferase
MQIIVKIKFGSHLYGTATEQSDLDIKGIYIPNARDILLQRVKSFVSCKPIKIQGKKNSPSDIDYELYSPKKFLTLLASGQTVALDMLFAPPSAMLQEPDPIWYDIKNLAPQLLTKQASTFVRYCSHHANKYGNKGARITAVKLALEHLLNAEVKYGTTAKLAVIADKLTELATSNEFFSIDHDTAANDKEVIYFKICGKKIVFNATIKSARELVQKLVNSYGERALAAEANDGIDWKTLSHAIRIGREAIEYLNTHQLTFPRPEANHLLEIKLGKLPYSQVSDEIEKLLIEVEVAMKNSTLPETYNQGV